jgi:acyl-coenzyme A synthetase/AMP-(fatty) acid ligase
LGGIISPANPDFGPKELEYQLKATKAAFIITHPDALETSASAAQSIGLSPERILVFDVPGASTAKLVTVNDLVKRGSQLEVFTERKLRPGEGKTKLAFLSFSSGMFLIRVHYCILTKM